MRTEGVPRGKLLGGGGVHSLYRLVSEQGRRGGAPPRALAAETREGSQPPVSRQQRVNVAVGRGNAQKSNDGDGNMLNLEAFTNEGAGNVANRDRPR